MDGALQTSWLEHNHRLLAAELARIKQRLRGGAEEAGASAPEAGDAAQPPAAIDHLTGLLGLTPFERDVLLLCAGVEMDSEIAVLCGKARGHAHPAHATFGLALGALHDPHWSALTPDGPLRRWRLLDLEPGPGLTTTPLHIEERVLHYLAGINVLDARLRPHVHAGPDPGLSDLMAPTQARAAQEVARVLQSSPGPLLIHLCGGDPEGQEDVAAVAAHSVGARLFIARAADLPAGAELDSVRILWERESVLLGAALLIQCSPEGFNPPARQLALRLPGLVLLASREPVSLTRAFLRFDVDKPGPAEQRLLWESALGAAAPAAGGAPLGVDDLDNLAGQFHLSARTISSTGTLAAPGGSIPPKELWNICRALSRPRLEELAQRLPVRAGWDDLVLPEPQMSTLRHLAAQVRHRVKVHHGWGFGSRSSRGLGITALFAGESGVGKTHAAEVLARDLALDLYRVDVASVVSKYIGETSKNLRQVLDAAEEGGVLLLFDEADALFGKRSDVKDSHDRYANIDVAYLLQRLEAYQGLAILTSNMKTALDRAFHRRLRFIVTFPFPDAAQREGIWQRVFPHDTPTAGLDYRKLAQLNMPGGNIRNIALNAAFLAAHAGTAVTMAHLLHGAQLEAHKLERALSEAEIRGWA